MGMRINPKWEDKIRSEIAEYLDRRASGYAPKHIDETSSFSASVQWLVCLLSKKGIAFKVVQLGAGVRRVTTDVAICTKCNGTGRC
jgi:hypothetical protein